MSQGPFQNDRRHGARVPIDLWVEEDTGEAVYFQRSANLSAGGLFIEQGVPQPVGTTMKLRFQLPDENLQVRMKAEIVQVDTEATTGMHLKFVEISNEVAQQITRFVERHSG